MSGDYGDDQRFDPIGEPWDLPALRAEFGGEWDIAHRGHRVTAVLKADPAVTASPGPVTVAVLRNMLRAWRVAEARGAGPRP